MSWSLADARFTIQRASGLIHRGLKSVRTRGWRATWQRIKAQLHVVPIDQRSVLYLPAASASSAVAFAEVESPQVSIVIPVYGQIECTLACLRALTEHPPVVSHEVIVIDDHSPDSTPEALRNIPGLRFERRERNGGFIDACNDGARLARGTHLVFLNNDTVPQPGWLDRLVDTFEEHPMVGLAGAQLLFADGRLQEAGGVVRKDGQADNIGRFQSPRHPLYSYVRRVDYCSGAALAIPRALFQRLDGFNVAYAPAYYEDTDLGLRVKREGLDVLYQPSSTVLHIEGATAGRDERTGVKAHQAINLERLRENWSDTLPSHPDHEVSQAELTRHLYARSILIVDALTPTPDQDSGSQRMVNLMRLLREEGAHVAFLPANRTHAGADTRRLQQLGIEAWYAPFAARAPAWMREHGHRFDVVMLSRHYVASEFLPLVRRHAPQARVVFDTVDLHYLREQRGAELAGDAALRRAAARTRAQELGVIGDSDVTLVVSEVERELLGRDAPNARVEIVSNLHRLPAAGAGFGHRRDLVFVGGFRHPPNVDGVSWFAREVFPRVRDRLPDVRFHCIGGHVPEAIAALASQPGVVVHGHVPDIDPYMDGCRVSIAPLRYGAGVKGKVNLSMAHGQPVVATPVAVEGMHLVDGRDVLVAGDADAFADAVVRLHEDEALWTLLSAHGRDNVQRHFSLDAARDTVRRVFFDR